MKPVQQIIKAHGIDKKGDVQLFLTNTINHRITRYMPYLTSTLSTKLKFVKSPTQIEVLGPYAKYQYYGKVCVDPKTNAAGFLTKNGWRSRKGVNKVKTNRPLNYTKNKHPLAGPFWDRRLMQAEGKAIAEKVSEYANKKK